MSREIIVLIEGKTEEETLKALKEKRKIHYEKPERCRPPEFRTKIKNYLEPHLKESPPVEDSIGIVVIRDCDSGKCPDDYKKSTENAIKESLKDAGIREKVELLQHPEHLNIFFVKKKNLNFTVILHVAQNRSIEGIDTSNFKNSTTDDYILDLAMRIKTIENLDEFIEAKQKNPKLIPEEVQKKIKSEIFGILQKNGIVLKEAKSFVNLYIAVLQIGGEGSLRYRELPGKVIEHAREEDIKEVFDSWIAAFNIIKEVNP